MSYFGLDLTEDWNNLEANNTNNALHNEEFNSRLDNLKDVYYSITPKDEAVLNSILDKYL